MSKYPEIVQLLDVIDRAYNRKSWHGTNLRGSIRGLSASDAGWRPQAGRHNVHEIVVHAAYWKYVIWRRLSGERRGSFPLKGSNWFPRTAAPDERAWKEDVALLDRMHRSLREAIERLGPSDLKRTAPNSKAANFELIAGVAAHDVYHAGQIQLLKRLHRDAA